MKKAIILVLLLMILTGSYAIKPIQLLVEGQEADIKEDAYIVRGSNYNLTVNITNSQDPGTGAGAIDVLLLLDASYSFEDEIDAVSGFIENLGTHMEQTCTDIGSPDCFRLGVYVFEGGECNTRTRTYEECDKVCDWQTGCWDCKKWGKDEDSCKTWYTKKRVCVKTDTGEDCRWHDDVEKCTKKSNCLDYDPIEIPREVCDWVCVEQYCGKRCIRVEENCRTETRIISETCNEASTNFYNNSAFVKPIQNPPLDWSNDVGVLTITDSMESVKLNLDMVSAYDPVRRQKEPWGDIIRYSLQAPEIGWTANRQKVIILITDEVDETGDIQPSKTDYYKTAAQLAKDEGAIVFGIIGKGSAAATVQANPAYTQAEYVADETGGQVYAYNNTSELTAAIQQAIDGVIGKDYMNFSREFGPSDWSDSITDNSNPAWAQNLLSGSAELPPIPRDGQVYSFTVTGTAPASWANPVEYFQYRISLKEDPTIYDDGWIQIGNNQPPTADFECVPTEGMIPLTVECTDKSIDPESQPLMHQWEFEPGVTSSAQNPSHTYQTGGMHGITLTVTDSQGESSSIGKLINAKQNPAITLLNVNHPSTKNDPVFIVFSCNKQTNIKLSYYDNEDNSVFPDDVIACSELPSTSTKGNWPESAVYKIVAVITDAAGNPDLTCDNCPKTVYTVVGREIKELETPETTLVLVAGVAFVIIAIISRKN